MRLAHVLVLGRLPGVEVNTSGFAKKKISWQE